MTNTERIKFTSIRNDLHYAMLHESNGDWVDYALLRQDESNYRFVLALAFEGIKAKIISGIVFPAN